MKICSLSLLVRSISTSVLVALAAPSAPAPATYEAPRSPQVRKVLALLTEMKGRVEEDGRLEQVSYDKYACWCEKTLERKAQDIANGKTEMERLQTLILKLEGDLGSMKADIASLNKNIADNEKEQEEATEVRSKAHEEFMAEKTESVQCLGALDAAIKTLSNAGTGKFLETMHQAELLSVAAGVRTVLQKRDSFEGVPDADMEVLKRFLDKPSDVSTSSKAMVISAAQVGQNPFGDYAPQSTVIQGILKEMETNFKASLQEADEEEATQQKAFEELMSTKRAELKSLKDTLTTTEATFAAKSKLNADSKVGRDDTIAQVKADEAFFGETKDGCKTKAIEWAKRCELRTQELQGIQKAVAVLSEPSNQLVFGRSYTTLLQLDTKAHSAEVKLHDRRSVAVAKLRAIAARHQSKQLTAMATTLQSGGYFDKVIAMIDQTMEVLRQEEKDDIAQRDRCQQQGGKNKNDIEDLDGSLARTSGEIERINDDTAETKTNIAVLTQEITDSEKQLADLLSLRNQEVVDFKQALKDDSDAIALIEQALAALTAFYKQNNIPMELPQLNSGEPEYFNDPDKPPETTWAGGDYGGRKSENRGIVSILGLIKQDIANEMTTAREEDAEAQESYAKSKATLEASLAKDKKSRVQAEKTLADLSEKLADKEEDRSHTEDDLAQEKKMESTLEKGCAWVETHFASRRAKRKSEMAGLVDAKTYLQGVEDGTVEDDLE